MTRSEILSNIYCPAAPSTGLGALRSPEGPETKLASASAVCIDGSRAALALSWSNNGSRHVDARRQEAVLKAIAKSEKSNKSSDLPPILGCNTAACERSEHKNFVVVSHGFPIDPDYAILTRPGHHVSRRVKVPN